MIAFIFKWFGVIMATLIVYNLSLYWGGGAIAFTAGGYMISWAIIAAIVVLFVTARLNVTSK